MVCLGLSAAHAASLQAQLAAHYGPSLPPGLIPPQALLQYQLAAASSLGQAHSTVQYQYQHSSVQFSQYRYSTVQNR